MDKRYTPEILSTSPDAFSIPLYQRLFEWGEKQINGLLSDLYAKFKDCKDKEQRDYYIGMLTATNDFALVDGQQRFTLLMLMAVVFQKDNNDWGKILFNGDNLRLTYFARPNDEEYIARLAELEGSCENSYHNQKMDDAIRCIKAFLGKDDVKDNKEGFVTYIFEHLTFFVLLLSAKHDKSV